MTKSIFFSWIILALGTRIVFAETVPEVIKKAGLQDTLGTTPDQAGAADSLAFNKLPPRTYWMTKHTFRIATDAWNNQRIEESKGGSKPPLVVSDIFRDMLRNEYLHALNRVWPGITTQKYGAGATRKKTLITEGDPEAAAQTERPAPTDAPNARLARHIRDYYDAWLIEKKEDMPSIYQRFVSPLLSGGGAPLLGSSRDYAIFEAKIADSRGQLFQGSKLTLRVAKKNLWGSSTERTYYTNPIRLAVPCETYEVEATAEKHGVMHETIAFAKGATVARAYQLPAAKGSDGATPPPSAAVRWTNRAEAEELRRWYVKKLGTEAVVSFDPTKAIEQVSLLPTDHAKIMITYGFAGRWGSPWHRNTRRVSRVDGTGGAPNPAINDPCLNITFDFATVDAAKIGSTPEALRREIAKAVVEWANAFTGESEATNEPLTSFAINGEFFSRIAFRTAAERRSGTDMPAEAVASAEFGATTIRCFDFVKWDRNAFNNYAQAVPQGPKDIRPRSGAESFGGPSANSKTLGQADEVIDLTIRFVPQFTIRNVAPDAVAVFNNSAAHRGIVEILLRPEWRFTAEGEPRPQGQISKLFAFRNIILHELGHYFGLPHLPEPHSGHSFLKPCVMCADYSSTFSAVTPADAALVNAFEYLSLDVKGRICDGLSSK